MLLWNEANNIAREAALKRPAISVSESTKAVTQQIIAEVSARGDAALLDMAKKYDNRDNARLLVPVEEINASAKGLDKSLKQALDIAYKNIKAFHKKQLPKSIKLDTQPGVSCELKYEAIEAIGLYVPGGSAPLPSSVLMQGVCAQLSGASTVVLATPVKGNERIHPAILYAAKLCGITTIVEAGGAGAIAAMALGTESIPRVNKVFGPGNSFVTMAKQLLAQDLPGFAIDMPAGPSEVLVIADARANPAFVAADLLSQAEHGEDSQVVLICTSKDIIIKTQQQIEQQLTSLSRADIAKAALANSSFIFVESLEEAFEVSALYGPEHLILQIYKAENYVAQVKNAGSVFVGDYTPESAGDYASGTNHVLPTYGYSKVYSSLNLLDFFRTYTVQHITEAGLRQLSKAILPMAKAEGLDAHAQAVSIRLGAQQ
ncbi:Histidinol dehydrogenase [Pseudoalteromonas luteoviolacea B = ATCC 29581]|nr:Histidinol dehydrogenase [Pseudoalteromonas luteoviolacea B = ATCC 29581]